MCPWTSHIREEYRQPNKQKVDKVLGGHKCYNEKCSKVKRQGDGNAILDRIVRGNLSGEVNVSRDLGQKEVTAIIVPFKS